MLAGITNSKYAILKNEKNLNNEQKDKLIQVKKASSRLRRMHQLKEISEKYLRERETGLRDYWD